MLDNPDIGFYVLLRRVFVTTPWSALLGAGLFLFNGFYAHRMIVGHLTYHPFMLLPTLAFFLLRPSPEHPPQRLPLTYDAVMAGLLMAYIFQAGMVVNVALPLLASVVVIGLLYSLMQQQPTMFYRRLLLGGGVAVALCSAKLVAATAYLQHFSRDLYRLPGLRSVFDATVLVVRSLCVGGEAAYELFPEAFVNLQWHLELHEFEFGITAVWFDRTVSPRLYQPAMVLLNSMADRTYYHAQPYDPSRVLQAYQRVQHHHWTPVISHMAVFTDDHGREIKSSDSNDVLTQGFSQILCYEPLFGYRLESFPRQNLSSDAVMHVNNGRLNLKNPACYVYPTANGCAPGDHFTVQQRPAAEAFITYRPFPFRLPGWQQAANLLNLMAVGGVLAYFIVALMKRWGGGHKRSDAA